MAPPRPIRVLHVLGSLAVGGAESWLSQVVQRLDRARFETHFLVHAREPGALAPVVRRAGCRVEVSTAWRSPLRYRRDFSAVLARLGPVDVVHSHVHHYSGLVLALAAWAGVPGRIAHSHTDTLRLDQDAGVARRAYLRAMERSIRRYATTGLAASALAAVALFGPDWRRDPRRAVLHCGVDLARFRAPIDRDRVRHELGLRPDDLVVGHLGRFSDEKNHRFLVQVAVELARVERRARFLWVGEGPLRAEIHERLVRLGLAPRAVLPGLRLDVPAMLAAMDVFAFPSRWEGLGLGLVEAQAAGLPCVASCAVPAEATVVPRAVHTLDLREGPSRWAAALLRAWRADRWERRLEPLAAVEASTFNLDRGMGALEAVYRAP